MTNTGTLQVTTPSSRKLAMTRSMLSEMVVAVSGATRVGIGRGLSPCYDLAPVH